MGKKKTRPNGISMDFCPNRQKALGSEWEAKSATSSQFWYRTRGEAEIYATMEVPGRINGQKLSPQKSPSGSGRES